jgi:hypothetical protein
VGGGLGIDLSARSPWSAKIAAFPLFFPPAWFTLVGCVRELGTCVRLLEPQMKRPSAIRRPLPGACRPVPYRPQIETLECRCLPSTVMNLNDSGPDSLRQAILDARAGDTVVI